MSVDWSTFWLAIQAIGGLGILGTLLTLLFGVWRDRAQRRTELEGLLRMLLVEIEQNERHFRAYKARPALITHAPQSPRWVVWEDTRMRLAQLLEEEHTLSELAHCYDMIQQIEVFRHIDEDKMEKQDVIKEIEDKIPTAIDRCQQAAKLIREYVPEAPGAFLPPSEK